MNLKNFVPFVVACGITTVLSPSQAKADKAPKSLTKAQMEKIRGSQKQDGKDHADCFDTYQGINWSDCPQLPEMNATTHTCTQYLIQSPGKCKDMGQNYDAFCPYEQQSRCSYVTFDATRRGEFPNYTYQCDIIVIDPSSPLTSHKWVKKACPFKGPGM